LLTAPPPATRPAHLDKHPLIGDWIGFDRDRVQVKTGKVELGQGIHAALATIAAEELHVAASRVDVMPVSTRESPDEDYTAGSLSITQSGAAVRIACAAARALLLEHAGRAFSQPLDSLRIDDGVVRFERRTLSYWDDWSRSGLQSRFDAVPTRDQRSRDAGVDGLRHDLRALFEGRRGFVHDFDVVGLLHGRVVRPSPPARALEAVDDTRTRAIPGVVAVIRSGGFLGVLADREDVAVRAAERLRTDCRWAPGAIDAFDERGDWLEAHAEPPAVVFQKGSQSDADGTVATYNKPHIAHASIGPSAAVARWTADGQLEVWSHTQGVYPLKRELATILGLPADHVHVTHVEGAGCYGHNGAEDAALDAALLARAVPGRSVKLIWSRADESGHEPYGSAMRMRLSARLDERGQVAAWRHEFWSNGHVGRPGFCGAPVLIAASELNPDHRRPVAMDPPLPPGGSQRNSVPLYAFPSVRIVHRPVRHEPLRVSSLRALGAFGNVFAIESFMDELAASAAVDPVDFRLRHLDDPRARAVIELAAARGAWAETRPDRAGRGIAFARYKNVAAYCAVVAEVSDDAPLGVSRLVVCVDAGRVITLDGVVNQVEGGAIQAASWTLKESVRPRDGAPPMDWDSYPIMRFTEVPRVETFVLDRPDAPSLGVGECVAGPVAAAIANAFADAYHVRLRDLPLTRERVLAALQD
jgi:CO/xanthine dehydrogenase Mo-binding subunit